MNSEVLAALIMLLSALSYGVSYVFQHKGTQDTVANSTEGKVGPAKLLKNKFYLTGVILFILGFCIHIVALAFGSVSVVQPLIVTELIFIPFASAILLKTKISGKEWGAIVAVTAGLAGFLFVAMPTEGHNAPTFTDWVITIGGTVLVCAILTGVGVKSALVIRAALLGISAGLVNGLMALTAKGALHGSIVEMLSNPLTYLTILIALSTFATVALAFKAGPITISSPSIIATNPVYSTLMSMWLFGDIIRSGPLAIGLIVICVVVTIAGVFYLSAAEHKEEEIAEALPHATESPGTA